MLITQIYLSNLSKVLTGNFVYSYYIVQYVSPARVKKPQQETRQMLLRAGGKHRKNLVISGNAASCE